MAFSLQDINYLQFLHDLVICMIRSLVKKMVASKFIHGLYEHLNTDFIPKRTQHTQR